MSFTDDDLARLTELLDDPQASGFFTEDMARGILARLAAAEKCMDRSWMGHTKACQKGKNLSGGPSVCICDMGDLYMKWRKAAGKESR